MWKLIKTINAVDPSDALDEKRLEKAFAKWWEVFDNGLKEIREKHKTEVRLPERSETELLAEILDNTRAIQRAVERIEANEKLEFPISSLESLSGISPTSEFWLRSLKPTREVRTQNIAKLAEKLSEIAAQNKAETPTPNLDKLAKKLSEAATKNKAEKKGEKEGDL
jgi:hypothetical protein